MRLLHVLTLVSFASAGMAARADGLLTESSEQHPEWTVTNVGPSTQTRGRLGLSATGITSRGMPLSVGLSTQLEPGTLARIASVRWALSRQERGLLDVTAMLRLRSAGMENGAPELDAKLAIGRQLGRLRLDANVLVGRSLSSREDLDVEASAALAFRLADAFHAGLEARLRGELVDGLRTDDDLGRPVGLLTGATLAWRFHALILKTLAGFRAPRGLVAPGPALLAFASLDAF